MSTLSARLKPYVGTRDFYRGALSVMVPVVIQQTINALFNVVDNVMVGGIGASAMSAVTAANKPYSIYFGFFFGMCGAAGLMISQYFGSGDRKTCQRLFALQQLLGLVLSVAAVAVVFCCPEQLMRLFMQEDATVALGVDYLRLVCWSYFPSAISSVCMFSMRAIGHNKMPMQVSIAAMLSNALFNYLFIYVLDMGVKGAALGTLLARLIEMTYYLYVLARRRAFFSLNLTCARHLTGEQIRSFLRLALPLTINEILYNLGYSIYFRTYSVLNEAAIPAVTIAEIVEQLIIVLNVGMSSAVSVMVGTALGAGRFKEAVGNTKKLFAMVTGLAAVFMVLGFGVAFVLPLAFSVSDGLRALATKLTFIYCLFMVPNSVYAMCFYCLRAGGDTRAATLLDAGFMWLLPVPAALLMGAFGVGSISLTFALTLIQVLINLKVIPGLIVLRRGKWVRNITV